LHSILSAGQYWKAAVIKPEDNKYAMPDYTHFSLDLFYTPARLKNLQAELLIVYKWGSSEIPEDPYLILNKVDLLHTNLVVNYTF
jgi:hypothetical protein